MNSSTVLAWAQLNIISNLPVALAISSGFLETIKSTAPYDFASYSLSGEVDIAEVFIPIAAENLIAKCPNPPIPIIATSFFGLKYLFKGAKTVIPAHKRGGAKC